MSILSMILRHAAPAPGIEAFDRFLFLGPHPDDIEIGAGATVSKLAAMGRQITFLICTDGRYGLTNAPKDMTPGRLVGIRQQEALASAEKLGVSDVRFLDYEDGGFYDIEELTRAVAAVIGDVQPQVIFAPDPTVHSECHVDHLRVGEIGRRLAVAASNRGIMARFGAKSAPVEALAYYMTARPNRFVGVRGHFNRQLDALFTCFGTQFPAASEDARTLRLYLRLRAVDFGLRSRKGLAEGFRVMGKTQMHCLPEADL